MGKRKVMKYFLIVGLMMLGSFVQADICNPLWWQSATPPQVEAEAERIGPSAMNVPCPDGVMPLVIATENSNNAEVFSAVIRHFDLDEETQSQVIDLIVNMSVNQIWSISNLRERVNQLSNQEWSINSLVELIENSGSLIADTSYKDYVRATFYLFGFVGEEYDEIFIDE